MNQNNNRNRNRENENLDATSQKEDTQQTNASNRQEMSSEDQDSRQQD